MPDSSELSRKAELLLTFMRDPTSLISSVTEECVLGDREILRRLELDLNVGSLDSDSLYLDVLHVEKASLVEITVEQPQSARLAHHGEHVAISEYLIAYRFLRLWDSASLPEADRRGFDRAMLAVLDDLAQIPSSSTEDAKKTFKRHFDESKRLLKLLAAYPSAEVSATQAAGLYELCIRLTDRYLVLLKVKAEDVEHSPVILSYKHEISEMNVTVLNSRGRAPADKPPINMRHMKYATQPTSFRVHVPWAKRTSHYSFKMDPADNYFIARHAVLVRVKRRIRRARRSSSPFKWSINSNQGRRSLVYLGDARQNPTPIYVGLQNTELPGRSTSRVFSLTWAVVAAMVAFTVLRALDQYDLVSVSALILSLAAVGAFAATPSPGSGVLGSPLLSRFVPPSLTFILVGFIFWLSFPKPAPDAPLIGVILFWVSVGVPIVPAVFLASWLTIRRRALIRNYTRVAQEGTLHSKNFYSGEDSIGDT